MENTATDYKKLYEQELEAHRESLLTISKKEDKITDLEFELEQIKEVYFRFQKRKNGPET